MRKPKFSTKKPTTQEQVLDEMIPKRSIDKTRDKLDEHKSIHSNKIPRYAKRYGFKSDMILFLSEDLTETQIIEKFSERLNSKPITTFEAKLGTPTPRAIPKQV